MSSVTIRRIKSGTGSVGKSNSRSRDIRSTRFMGGVRILHHDLSRGSAFIRGLFMCLLLATAAHAATLPPGFTETAISGLANPTAMEIAPDGRIFVCQQGGSLRVIKNSVLLSTPFLTLSVDANGERGLLGIAFDLNFASNNFLYVYYTVSG